MPVLQPISTEAELATPVPEVGALGLNQLAVGCRAAIVALKDEDALLYLLRLGVVVGAEVEVVRKISRGSILVVRLDCGELALRSDAAAGITVRVATDDMERHL